MNDEYYMNLALKEAYKAYKRGEVPVGAILVLNDKIIAKAHNTRQKTHDIVNHAEMIAIRKASRKIHDWRLNDAVLYITMSPCPMCASAIKESRIKRVVVGATNKDLKIRKIVDLIFKIDENCSSFEIKKGILEDECIEILQKFFKEQRTKHRR